MHICSVIVFTWSAKSKLMTNNSSIFVAPVFIIDGTPYIVEAYFHPTFSFNFIFCVMDISVWTILVLIKVNQIIGYKLHFSVLTGFYRFSTCSAEVCKALALYCIMWMHLEQIPYLSENILFQLVFYPMLKVRVCMLRRWCCLQMYHYTSVWPCGKLRHLHGNQMKQPHSKVFQLHIHGFCISI